MKLAKGLKSGRNKKHYKILKDAVHAMNADLDPEQVMKVIMHYVEKLIPSEGWSIVIKDENIGDLKFEMAAGIVGYKITAKRLPIGNGIVGWVVQTGKHAIIKNAHKDKRFNACFDKNTNFVTKTILCLPIISRGKILGAVEIINRKGKKKIFTIEDYHLLKSMLEPAGIALENAFLFKRVQQLIITDDLTQLYNYRYVHQYLVKAIQDYKQNKKESKISLIFLDLDGFKEVDDNYGHIVGGNALKIIGERIKNAVDENTIVARYGGDEFAIILPDTNANEAVQIAERIRKAIELTDFNSYLNINAKVTASIGIAIFPDHATEMVELIQKADKAMYEVKYATKNNVKLAN